MLPVPVRELVTMLPHRPPMIWIDEVVEAAADGGICAVDLDAQRLYAMGAEHCLAFAPIEWMAQAYGYARACHARHSGAAVSGLKRAFLVGIGELDLVQPITARGRLLIEVRLTRELAPLALLRGVIRADGGAELARAKLKVYFES